RSSTPALADGSWRFNTWVTRYFEVVFRKESAMANDNPNRTGSSRRDFIKGAALATGGAVLAGSASRTVLGEVAAAADSSLAKGCEGLPDLALFNGRFLTMDGKNSVASAGLVCNARIAEWWRTAQAIGPCA